MILYNRKKVKYRKDGYCWKKRKDGKTTREDHMKLKVQGVERVDSDGSVFFYSRYEQQYNRGAATQYVLPAHPRLVRSIRAVLFRIITLPYQSASDLFTANANK
ncbi:Calmodulin-binding transcription activator 1 [Anabarilius grahami]|uniref:Calmodulin-binding transcription activator 1 n=1 Tax=Anabarilius grahami TaxID=495550 RepID=A0A3N0YLC6_ANAGA|nr:Calmodulin-binding transcription activator 1 [Anabarilius grahami]